MVLCNFLNSDFIPHDRLRLDIYRRLSKCEDSASVYEIFGEIEDRFGRADIYTKQFIDLMVIKVLAQNCGIKAISSMDENILITQSNGEKIRLKARTRDDDDVLDEILVYLRKIPHTWRIKLKNFTLPSLTHEQVRFAWKRKIF